MYCKPPMRSPLRTNRLMKKACGDRLPHGRGSVNTCKHAVAILSRAPAAHPETTGSRALEGIDSKKTVRVAREQAVYCLFQHPAKAWLFACLMAFAVAASAAEDPVTWSGKPSPAKPLVRGARFTVELDALIQPGWHLYSLDQPDGGPIATEISLPDGQPFAFAGIIAAPKPRTVFDSNFNMRVGYYLEKVQFHVPLEVGRAAAAGTATLNIQTRYQCCNDRLCLPPKKVTVPISVEIHP